MFTVIETKTGKVLGQIEKFYKAYYTHNGARRHAIVWFRLVGNESVNADTKSCLAAYLGKGAKTKVVKN